MIAVRRYSENQQRPKEAPGGEYRVVRTDVTNERVTSRELMEVPGLPSKGELEEAPCAAKTGVSISHNASRDFCTTDTSSLYVTNEHDSCGNSHKGFIGVNCARCPCSRVAI